MLYLRVGFAFVTDPNASFLFVRHLLNLDFSAIMKTLLFASPWLVCAAIMRKWNNCVRQLLWAWVNNLFENQRIKILIYQEVTSIFQVSI